MFERGLFFKCHNGRDDLWTQVQQSARLFHDGSLLSRCDKLERRQWALLKVEHVTFSNSLSSNRDLWAMKL